MRIPLASVLVIHCHASECALHLIVQLRKRVDFAQLRLVRQDGRVHGGNGGRTGQ
jgi:hypothetical protein